MSFRSAARRTSAQRDAQPDTAITAAQFFRLAYQREPSAAEDELLHRLVGAYVTTPSEARAVLLAFDHQVLPTSFELRFAEDDLLLVDLASFSLWVDRRDVSVSAVILDRNEWEPHVDAVLREVLRPGDTFVDVGANIGYHTFLASSIVGSKGQVHAFEPNPENCRLLWLSRHQNRADQVVLHALALDSSPGLRYLTSHLGSNGGLVGNEPSAVRSGHGSFVTAARLDDVDLPPIRLLKVDVEGAEFAVLGGASKALGTHKPHLILEFSAEMAARVSEVEPFRALQDVLDGGYSLSVLERDGTGRTSFESADALRLAWRDESQIQDLLLTPLP